MEIWMGMEKGISLVFPQISTFIFDLVRRIWYDIKLSL